MILIIYILRIISQRVCVISRSILVYVLHLVLHTYNPSITGRSIPNFSAKKPSSSPSVILVFCPNLNFSHFVQKTGGVKRRSASLPTPIVIFWLLSSLGLVVRPQSRIAHLFSHFFARFAYSDLIFPLFSYVIQIL